jgi:hypothetical protein
MAEAIARWSEVVAQFAREKNVAVGEGRGFGAGALKVNGKIFAFIASSGAFVVKLSKPRAAALFASGAATPFDPGHGRAMKQWAAFAADADWLALAREAKDFVGEG